MKQRPNESRRDYLTRVAIQFIRTHAPDATKSSTEASALARLIAADSLRCALSQS